MSLLLALHYFCIQLTVHSTISLPSVYEHMSEYKSRHTCWMTNTVLHTKRPCLTLAMALQENDTTLVFAALVT
jgi:hypothetical protein